MWTVDLRTFSMQMQMQKLNASHKRLDPFYRHRERRGPRFFCICSFCPGHNIFVRHENPEAQIGHSRSVVEF